MSAAKAACDHMKDWWLGTPEGTFTSMAVYSDGSYGTPKGVVFSFPGELLYTMNNYRGELFMSTHTVPYNRATYHQSWPVQMGDFMKNVG